MVCKEHNSLVELITSVREDIAAMRAENKAQKESIESMEKRTIIVLEKLTSRTESNSRYIYMAIGALTLLSFAVANMARFIK